MGIEVTTTSSTRTTHLLQSCCNGISKVCASVVTLSSLKRCTPTSSLTLPTHRMRSRILAIGHIKTISSIHTPIISSSSTTRCTVTMIMASTHTLLHHRFRHGTDLRHLPINNQPLQTNTSACLLKSTQHQIAQLHYRRVQYQHPQSASTSLRYVLMQTCSDATTVDTWLSHWIQDT